MLTATDKYIIVINKTLPVGRIRGNMIYKVLTTELLPLHERQLRDPEEDRLVALVKENLRTSPLYFSYTHDVTSSFQRQADADPSQPLWQRADDRFFWNRFVQSDLVDFRLGRASRFGSARPQPAVDPYILPVMFGMLEIVKTSVRGTPIVFVLTSRRSRFRVGTRYLSRGIDEDGHVSNFNETEQAIVINDDASRGPVSYAGDGGMQSEKLRAAVGREAQVLAYVQTRGSVPVYWAETNNLHYVPPLQIRGVDSAVPAARRHFAEQVRTYGDVWMVNLVNQKGREVRVKEAYEQMVDHLVTRPRHAAIAAGRASAPDKLQIIEPAAVSPDTLFDHLHYIYFDFHTETKGLRWHRAELLLRQLAPALQRHGYFRAAYAPGSAAPDVRARQTAVVRTNCMDCLDRTNVIQSMIARHMLVGQLVDAGALPPGSSTLVLDDVAFERLFKNTWADNADAVSLAYSGSGALKADFTRTGVRSKKGAMQDGVNSVTRYVKNNFLDGARQDAYDVVLGAYRPGSEAAASRAGVGGRVVSVFADRRPLAVQAVPYVLAAAALLIAVGSFSRRGEAGGAVWPLRLLMVLCFVAVVVCLQFMWANGALYVSASLLSWAGDTDAVAGQLAEAEPAGVCRRQLPRCAAQSAQEPARQPVHQQGPRKGAQPRQGRVHGGRQNARRIDSTVPPKRSVIFIQLVLSYPRLDFYGNNNPAVILSPFPIHRIRTSISTSFFQPGARSPHAFARSMIRTSPSTLTHSRSTGMPPITAIMSASTSSSPSFSTHRPHRPSAVIRAVIRARPMALAAAAAASSFSSAASSAVATASSTRVS